jgi:hypothetical protein
MSRGLKGVGNRNIYALSLSVTTGGKFRVFLDETKPFPEILLFFSFLGCVQLFHCSIFMC